MKHHLTKKQPNESRILALAEYVIKHKSTIRQSASVIGCSKSTAHLDLSERLAKIDAVKYKKVHTILAKNATEKHIRGGMSTQKLLKGTHKTN